MDRVYLLRYLDIEGEHILLGFDSANHALYYAVNVLHLRHFWISYYRSV
jgi:hypothetical protein